MVEQSLMDAVYCFDCARKVFRIWKGWCSEGTQKWPEAEKVTTLLPDIPQLHEGHCPQCGSKTALLPQQVFYKNYHGEGNTGLPDYFILKIAAISELEQRAQSRRWGMPYLTPGIGRIPMAEVEGHVRRLFESDWSAEHDPEKWFADRVRG